MSLAPATAAGGFRLTGWHVLAMIVGFFAVVIGVDVGFTVMAVRTFPGQVSVTPYEDGLLYNRKLVQLAAQETLGWRASAQAGGDQVTVALRSRNGEAVSGLTVNGKLERPATEAGRIPLSFREQAPGVYVARAGVQSGAWDLTFAASNAKGDRFEGERRLTWR